MDVSSSTSTSANAGSVQLDALKKSIDVAEQNTLKVLESVSQQSKEMTAQKTGMGNNLNITA